MQLIEKYASEGAIETAKEIPPYAGFWINLKKSLVVNPEEIYSNYANTMPTESGVSQCCFAHMILVYNLQDVKNSMQKVNEFNLIAEC